MAHKQYRIFINENFSEKRIAICTRQQVDEFWIDRGEASSSDYIVGNIYLGSVDRVLKGMQAAFVDIGLEKNGFLYGGDITPDSDDTLDYFEDVSQAAHVTPSFEALKQKDKIFVQVTKGPISTKGPRLTTNISIPGKFLVLLPQTRRIGISKKIQSGKIREKLHHSIRSIRRKNNVTYGVIIRTAASNINIQKVQQEYLKLTEIWKNTLIQSKKVKPPELLYTDSDILDRILREYCANPRSQIIVDSKSVYEQLVEKAKSRYFFPVRNISLYSKRSALFEDFGIEQDIQKATDHRVWLKSGSYLIFDETEALTVIDVNTGRYVGKKNLEDTLVQTNLEASTEIVHQIILRNLSGIIIVDFIDMDEAKNRQLILDTLKKLLREDKTRNSVLSMTQLGLVQITRKRTHASLLHQLTNICPYCDGKGKVKSLETIVLEILRRIKYKHQASKRKKRFIVKLSESVHKGMTSTYKNLIKHVENELNIRITLKTKDAYHQEEYEIL